MSNWQPIETAPKDGCSILVIENDEINIVSWDQWDSYKRCPKGWCVKGSWQDEQGGYETVDRPTHWMPMPNIPPKQNSHE